MRFLSVNSQATGGWWGGGPPCPTAAELNGLYMGRGWSVCHTAKKHKHAIQTKGGLMLRITRTQRSVLLCHFWLSSFSSALNFFASLIPAGPGRKTGPSHRQSITEPQNDTGTREFGSAQEEGPFLWAERAMGRLFRNILSHASTVLGSWKSCTDD